MSAPRADRHTEHTFTNGPKTGTRMTRASLTKWFRLRVACALGVLVLLVVQLSGHRSGLVVLLQTLLIAGIIVTSALDLRDLRRRRAAAGPPSK